MTKEQVLKKCRIEGNVVKLPEVQLERKLYLEVAKALNLIGGKWKGGKIMGFMFNNDPAELLAQIAGGEKRDLKKEFQFFATPPELADHLVKLACIEKGNKILEPSAGQGAIVEAINREFPGLKTDCYELMDINRTFLKKISTALIIGNDFLEHGKKKYDRIIANPPFTKNQDIAHIKEMYSILKPGGILVTIASRHWQFCNNKKETAFREWLTKMGAIIEEVEEETFKQSGTLIKTVIIKIVRK